MKSYLEIGYIKQLYTYLFSLRQDGKQGKSLGLYSPQPILPEKPWYRFTKLRAMEDTVWKPKISLKHNKDNKPKPHNLQNEAQKQYLSLKSQKVNGYFLSTNRFKTM